MTVRGFLMWVHLVLGLFGAVFLVIAGITGAYITFQKPLERWLNPVPVIPEFSGKADLPAIVRNVEAQFPSRRVATVEVHSHQATIVRLRDRSTVFVDPRESSIIDVRLMRFASLENLTIVMRRLHTQLLLGPKGRFLVAFATAEALLLALTGVWLWWRKKQWRLGRFRGSLFRVSWDLHNVTGIWFLVPVLAMTTTGVLIFAPTVIYRLAGAPPAPWPNPPVVSSTEPGRVVAPLVDVMRIADSALAGIPARRLVVPAGTQGVYAVEKPTATVFLEPSNGRIVEIRPTRVPTAGDSAYLTVERLHTGELFGLTGRAIMTMGSVMLAVMAITGLLLGWKRLQVLLGKMSD